MASAHVTLGSAGEATEAALSALDRWNPSLNAVITPMPEKARAAARDLDRAAAEGRWGGLLHGMPLTLKDNIDVAGLVTSAASRILAGNRADRDAPVTERLRRHGAVIVGKANLHEWVFGPTSQSLHYGPVRNPWNPRHIAGGSSGGSGACVAAGIGVASIGSDTGGSIRIPAAYNGVAGLRPTIGRVSNRGAVAVSAAYDTLGPLARRVSDVARVFAAIAGHDEEDPVSVDRPVPNVLGTLNEPVAGLRIGVMRRWFFDGLEPALTAALDRALDIYRELGAEIVEIDLGDVERAHPLMAFRIVLADAYALHRDQIAERRNDYGDDLLARFDLGAKVSGADYAEALRWREGFVARLTRAFRQVDAIFGPTTPGAAPAAGSDFIATVREITRFTYPWAFAGVPCLALPCGFDEAGLPLSMQLASTWFDEKTLLRLGHAYQGVTEHHLRMPPLPA